MSAPARTPVDAGYFPKSVVVRPEGLAAPAVREICSVSLCMSGGPDGWIQRWRHNAFGWFETVAEARAAVPPADHERFRLFAYRLTPEVFRGGVAIPKALPPDVHPEPIPTTFVRLGFDAVSRSAENTIGFECSPLSCNYMAVDMPTTDGCLFASLEAAVEGARRFSLEQPEPGDYYVVEVLEAPGPERAAGIGAGVHAVSE